MQEVDHLITVGAVLAGLLIIVAFWLGFTNDASSVGGTANTLLNTITGGVAGGNAKYPSQA